MTRRLELLAPGGDLDAIKAAIVAGADAIYCGLDKLNARHRATNITFDDLGGVLALAHRHDCRVFLTLNTMMVESDLPVLVGILNKLVNTSVDGIIVSDLGLFQLLSTHFKGLKIHASTQLTTHNEGQLKFLRRLGATRVNLSRELNFAEIGPLVRAAHEDDLLVEVFVHGSYCLSFSGICYMSSVHGGNSGNRGRCSQPCRDRYVTTPMGQDFPLNLKDNAAYFDLERLADAGVDALKIEGRMKTFHYVYTVTNTYKQQLQRLYNRDTPADDSADLYKVFNRDFSNAFLIGDIGRQMFSDHPRNRSATHLRERSRSAGAEQTARAKAEAYDEIADFKAEVREKIEHVRIAKAPLTVSISGSSGAPLDVAVRAADTSFVVSSETCLAPQREDSTVPPLNAAWFKERLKAVNETEYFIDELELEELQPGLFVPLKELTSIKRRILFTLNGSREPVDPVAVPVFAAGGGVDVDVDVEVKPTLSVLISAARDVRLCADSSAEIHYQLPNALKSGFPALVALFADNERLIPWFPSVLIGEDFTAAVRFLQQVRPGRIVTNNTGVAYEACSAGIPWIAGPYLNIANSLSLASLKQNFACHGAFVSNELSKYQIKRICPPEAFKLYYSIYHPIVLLTSRQCLFHQVTGCEKETMDDACISGCERTATITSLNGATLFINKTKGNYSSIYHQANFLNTKLLAELPPIFSSLLVDIREIETETRTALDKLSLVQLFERHLHGDAGSAEELRRSISPTTSALYEKGV
jgi:U32 family peptidase